MARGNEGLSVPSSVVSLDGGAVVKVAFEDGFVEGHHQSDFMCERKSKTCKN